MKRRNRMRAKVKNKAYAIHFAESRFNGKKVKLFRYQVMNLKYVFYSKVENLLGLEKRI